MENSIIILKGMRGSRRDYHDILDTRHYCTFVSRKNMMIQAEVLGFEWSVTVIIGTLCAACRAS